MRILITGSRDWTDRGAIREALSKAPAGSTVVHGAYRGADEIADTVARELGLRVSRYYAEWHTYGKLAGPIRNQRMINTGANVCLAFSEQPHKGGTGDCNRKARQAGIPVFVHPVPADWVEQVKRVNT